MEQRVISTDILERYARGEKKFTGLFIEGTGFEGKSLSGVTFEQVTFHEVDLTAINLHAAVLRDVNFEYASLENANLSKTTLQNITILGDNTFRGIDLREAKMQEVRLDTCNFEEANLEGAFLAHAQLQGAIFRRANLRGADLRGANLQQAVLRETILENVQRDAETNFRDVHYRNRVIAESGLLRELTNLVQEKYGEEQQPVFLYGRPLKITVQRAKQRIQEALHGRPDQQQFRSELLKAYTGRCAITGCDIEELLEAAHIIPFCLEPRNNRASNGILLRADLHRLFDLNYLEIDPQTGDVYLHQKLRLDPLYQHLHQQVVVSPPLLHLSRQLWSLYGQDERQWRRALMWRRDHYQEFLEQ